MLLRWWLNQGKMQSSESIATLEEVIVEKPQCQQVSMWAGSGPLTLAATCAAETSALNFIALCPGGVVVLCVV